jgi:hypothetical protein
MTFVSYAARILRILWSDQETRKYRATYENEEADKN